MQQQNLLYLLLFFLCICSLEIQAQVTVSETITETDNNTTLIGVTILEKGTTNGTVTDLDGKYTLEVSDDNATLVVSYIGYSTQKLAVGGKSTLDVLLETDVANLDEIVVVGYGVQKKSVVTGSISKVKAEELESMPVTRIEQSLQGRTSGQVIHFLVPNQNIQLG